MALFKLPTQLDKTGNWVSSDGGLFNGFSPTAASSSPYTQETQNVANVFNQAINKTISTATGAVTGAAKEIANTFQDITSGNPLLAKGTPFGADIKQPEKFTFDESESLSSKIIRSVLNPGTELITPGLKERGVNPSLASAIGFIGDVAAPGPGELGKITDITSEAKKYKSAEEFVKAQPTYYHTTTVDNASSIEKSGFSGNIGEMSKASGGDMQKGVFLYDEKSSADVFGKNFKNPKILEAEVDGKIYDANTQTKYGWEDNLQTQEIAKDKNIIEQLRKDGYVGVKSTELGTPATFVFEPSVVKTKSQLTDIWNKANKPTKLGSVKTKKERGFVTSVKEEFPEVRVAGQYIPRSTDDLAIRAKNLIKDDVETALKVALNHTDDEAIAIGSELIKHYGDLALKSSDNALRAALNDRAAEVANVMAKNLTELGRSIQAASILSRLTPEGQLRFAAREIQRYNEAVEKSRGGLFGLKKKIPELTGKEADELITEMNAIDKMADGEEKAIRFKNFQDKIRNRIPSSLYEKMVTVWKAGLLTGIKTSGLNIFSNLSHGGLETAKDVPAKLVDSIASLFTGETTIGLTTRTRGGVMEGVQKGWRYLKTGFDDRNIGSKLDFKNINFGKSFIGRALQKYEETVFRVIGAEDQPFYYGAKARSLYGQALAKTQKLSGAKRTEAMDKLLKNPTDEMLRYAVLDAETAVFQNDTALGRVARGIQNLPGGEVVLPFGKTPSAVATQILNYSPVGIAKTIIENAGKGRFDQRLFSQAMGRGLTGTAILAIGAEVLRNGIMSLDRPNTEAEQELWRAEGRTPNSIKIGDSWRSVQVLGPAGNLLLVGGHFANALEDTGSPTEAMSVALSGSVKSLTEQTFLRGLSDVIDAIRDPGRYGEGYLGTLLASIVPTIVSDIGRAMDPMERRAGTVLDKIKARLPVARETLEPQVDVLGRAQERAGNPLETLADPSRPSKIVETPVTQELRRLHESGQERFLPTRLGDKAGYDVLTPEQNTRLWARANGVADAKLRSLLSRSAYAALDDAEKAKTVAKIIDKSKVMARAELVLELTDGMAGEPLKKRLSELKKGGLMTKEVFTEYMKLR